MSFAQSMSLRRRWLGLTLPINGGPRPRSVLIGVAESHGHHAIAEPLLDLMLAEGTFVMHGERKAAKYGRPKRRAS